MRHAWSMIIPLIKGPGMKPIRLERERTCYNLLENKRMTSFWPIRSLRSSECQKIVKKTKEPKY